MAQARTMMAMALLGLALLSGSYAADLGPNAYAALSKSADFSLFGQACKAVGLDKDHWFTNGRWEATIYAPTNTAMKKFLGGKSVQQWVNQDKKAATHTLLQHMVSTYFLMSKPELYNGQKQASLLTLLNHRSRLTISTGGGKYYVSSEKTYKAKITTLHHAGDPHKRITIATIDKVLVPSGGAPGPKPRYDNLFNAIRTHPGLEDFAAAANIALRVNPGLKKQLTDTSKKFTVMAFNMEGMFPFVKLLGKSADELFNNPKNAAFMERLFRYHFVPNVRYTAADLKNHRTLTTLVGGHKLHMQYYHEHDVVAADYPVRVRGKFWDSYPRSLPSVMPGVPSGSYNLPVGANGMIHVLDGILIPHP